MTRFTWTLLLSALILLAAVDSGHAAPRFQEGDATATPTVTATETASVTPTETLTVTPTPTPTPTPVTIRIVTESVSTDPANPIIGETFSLSIRLRNDSDVDLRNVTITLNDLNAYWALIARDGLRDVTWPELIRGSSRRLERRFSFEQIDASGREIALEIDYEYVENQQLKVGQWNDRFILQLLAPTATPDLAATAAVETAEVRATRTVEATQTLAANATETAAASRTAAAAAQTAQATQTALAVTIEAAEAAVATAESAERRAQESVAAQQTAVAAIADAQAADENANEAFPLPDEPSAGSNAIQTALPEAGSTPVPTPTPSTSEANDGNGSSGAGPAQQQIALEILETQFTLRPGERFTMTLRTQNLTAERISGVLMSWLGSEGPEGAKDTIFLHASAHRWLAPGTESGQRSPPLEKSFYVSRRARQGLHQVRFEVSYMIAGQRRQQQFTVNFYVAANATDETGGGS